MDDNELASENITQENASNSVDINELSQSTPEVIDNDLVLQEDLQTNQLNEDLVEQQMNIDENFTLSDKVTTDSTVDETLGADKDETAEKKTEQVTNDNFAEPVQTSLSSTNIIDKLEQLPDTYNVSSTIDEAMPELQQDVQVEPTDILQEAAKKIEPNKWKPKSGAFSLGVPGLTFSAQNLKIANDGTKMVQIHQSQITPSQLQALQANPNIKVVFRHIPSGKSFTKPPKNLFSNKKSAKRKSVEDNHDIDDSVYNFDEFEDVSSRNVQAKIKSYNQEPTKFARYNPNVGFKRKQGRPKLQDSGLNADSVHAKPVLPAQIQLTDALVKLNKPGAEHTIKVHVKQVTHDILINMELNPKYNIVLTAKQDVAPEHSLEELVKEWEEKETLDQQPPESVPEPPPIKEPEPETPIKREEPDVKEKEEAEPEVQPVIEKPKIVTPEKPKPKQDSVDSNKIKEQQKLLKEEAEEAAITAALFETTSRSGRKRKPTRHTLEIAKMVKRRAVAVVNDDDDLPASKKLKTNQTSSTESKFDKKGRGRPRKNQAELLSSTSFSVKNEEEIKKLLRHSSPLRSEPRVMLSPADKRIADKKLFANEIALREVKKEIVENDIEQITPATYKEQTDEIEETKDESVPDAMDTTPQEKSTVEEKSDEAVMDTIPQEKSIVEEKSDGAVMDTIPQEKSIVEEKSDGAVMDTATEEKSTVEEKSDEAVMDIIPQEKLIVEEKSDEAVTDTATAEQSETKEMPAENAMDITPEQVNETEEKTSQDETSKPNDELSQEITENKVDPPILQDLEPSTKTADVTELSETETTSDDKVAGSGDQSEKEVTKCDALEDTKEVSAAPAAKSIALDATSSESPSDILARKLSKDNEPSTTSNVQSETGDTDESPVKDDVEEEENVDNKYRLRKLLQQCSIDEIRSVALPKALDAISIGDFFIHKAGQMSNKKVSFTSLYRQLEDFYVCMAKESIRYSTLLKRANKVGGDRRMEKVILMPVYNKVAADSLAISSVSVDAHIGGIYQKPTSPMIAANSFHINCKMEPPVHRLKLPEISDKSFGRKKASSSEYSTSTATSISSQQAHVNALTAQRSYSVGRPRGSYKRGYQVRKPSYLVNDQASEQSNLSLQEHARLQAASRYQPSLKQNVNASESPVTTNFQATPKTDVTTEVKAVLNQPVTTETVQLAGAVASEVVTQEGVETEEAATIVSAEDGKQLVAIGDGQFVELPEGYTLIQTDDGYLIGQAGATFVQGEDGNVYMTSTEDGAELTDQVLTTTADITATQPEEAVIEELNQS